MALTDYTDHDSIRAALGVSEDELEDEVLLRPLWTTVLEEALVGLNENLSENYGATKELATKTKKQQRFVNVLSAWATYQVALQLLTSVKMFAPRTLKSEKDEFERMTDPYANLRDDIVASMASLRASLVALYGELFPAEPISSGSTDYTRVINSAIAADPVTGV